jgi:heterodisulfide reductase subunit A
MTDSNETSVLVIGAGIGGVKASLELAESGLKVYLCDISPDIGGTIAKMDTWFPDSHCGMCRMLPLAAANESAQFCLRRGLNHPNIEFLPLTTVQKCEGSAGNFLVTVNKTPAGVERDCCSGCNACAEVCPVDVKNEFESGLSLRKAVYVRNPLIAANAYLIDWQNCTKCGLCADVCPNNAIHLDAVPETVQINVGAIILSTGFDEFNAGKTTEYGYGRFNNVVTSIEMERILSPAGPTGGILERPSDKKVPASLAFLQCVGSRELEWNYCSSACCMYAIKEAILAKEAAPDIDITVFYMDIRAFGKGNYRYFCDARDKYGIHFVRSRVPVIKENPLSGNILLKARSESGEILDYTFDMVVLSVGQVPSPGFAEMCRTLGIHTNKWGFCESRGFTAVKTSREGIFVCGSASAPKDIADTMTEAGAAAGQVAQLLAPDRAGQTESVTGQSEEAESRTAVFLCTCGGEIDSVVDIDALVSAGIKQPGVVAVEKTRFLCEKNGLADMVSRLSKVQGNRLILAGCSSSNIGRQVREALNKAGIADIPVQYINLREGAAWVHRHQPEAATEKSVKLLAMAAERARLQKNDTGIIPDVIGSALVIGGGISGMTAAESIAGQGYEVHLIEKTGMPGGNLTHIFSTLTGLDPRALLQKSLESINGNPLIHVYLESEVTGITGYAGKFHIDVIQGSEHHHLNVGAIVVAAGAEEYTPKEYSYGQNAAIVTHSKLETQLAEGRLEASKLRNVVMIQGVGSRNQERPYCSRICCRQAVKNALTLKKQNPDLNISILYRDMMTYGFMEEYYTKAREDGILFIRFSEGKEPSVSVRDTSLIVEVEEETIHKNLTLNADLVVLSPAVIAGEGNRALADILGVELTEDGFFKEAESKFRPVDFTRDGIYVCGMALAPANIQESITQALAASLRAVNILRRAAVPVSGMVAEVNPRWCTGCELCIPACPYGARIKDEGRGIVVVRESLCQGCGACAAVCPGGATTMKQFSGEQVFSMLDAGL